MAQAGNGQSRQDSALPADGRVLRHECAQHSFFFSSVPFPFPRAQLPYVRMCSKVMQCVCNVCYVCTVCHVCTVCTVCNACNVYSVCNVCNVCRVCHVCHVLPCKVMSYHVLPCHVVLCALTHVVAVLFLWSMIRCFGCLFKLTCLVLGRDPAL